VLCGALVLIVSVGTCVANEPACVSVLRWSRGEPVAEEKETRDAEKESSSRRRSRRDREQELAKKMTSSDTLSDRFESRGELRAVDNKYAVFVLFTPQPSYGTFSTTTQVSQCQEKTSGFMVQGKINRQTHRPSGLVPLHPD